MVATPGMIRGAPARTMRRMTEPTTPDVLALARDLRPALFGSGSAGRISNPVVEPLWTGVRVIAAATGDDGRPLPRWR